MLFVDTADSRTMFYKHSSGNYLADSINLYKQKMQRLIKSLFTTYLFGYQLHRNCSIQIQACHSKSFKSTTNCVASAYSLNKEQYLITIFNIMLLIHLS